METAFGLSLTEAQQNGRPQTAKPPTMRDSSRTPTCLNSIRSRKEEYPRFLPMAASLLQQLPAVLQRLAAHPKSTLRTRGETREL